MEREEILSVGKFNALVKEYLGILGTVAVEGEISELKLSQGKWLFLTIKDEEASVNVFGVAYQLPNWELLEVGMLVRVYGRADLYQKTARFSLMAQEIVPAGAGALQIAYEKLKLKLEKEGLFSPERKRPIPMFPEKIGLITAKGSQAYADFVKVLGARMGGLKIYFYPVQVQGRGAMESILEAFDYFNFNLNHLDVVVMARGGGSLEDLQAFNDERVVRAVFSSKIPVVAGVGHEENVTLADLVADLRASTPSNAAEQVVRDRKEVKARVQGSVTLMAQVLNSMINEQRQVAGWQVQLLDRGVRLQLEGGHQLLKRFSRSTQVLVMRLEKFGREVAEKQSRLEQLVKGWIKLKQEQLEGLMRLLVSLDYRRVLARGFSITTNERGKVLKSCEQTTPGEMITNMLANGKIEARVEKAKAGENLW